jgi:diguanylate cyclase (GGDEF)-like protein/PAS domain S-box-containing protein
MEVRTALLRAAARGAQATAAVVVRAGDDEPIATWGCDRASAQRLVREARRSPSDVTVALTIPLELSDGTAGELVLGAPVAGFECGAFAGLADEIGMLCGSNGAPPELGGQVDLFMESMARLGDAVAIFSTPESAKHPSVFVAVNLEFTRMFGFADDAIGQAADILWGPLTDRNGMRQFRSRITARMTARAATVLYARDRTPRWTEVVSTPVETSDAVHHVIVFRDVTTRKMIFDALAGEKQKLETTLGAIAEAVVTILADGVVDYVNEAAETLLGVTLAWVYGAHVGEVVRLLDEEAQPVDLLRNDAGEPVWRGRGILRTAGGNLDVAYTASRIDGNLGTVVVLRDVTAESRLAMRLTFEAAHDPLTGLQNRRAFLERLEDAVRGARERGEQHAVAYLDLDRFKLINDNFGHATGDLLLTAVSRVMGRSVRGGDVLARIGGDEFACLLTNCRLDDARRVAEKIRAAVEAFRMEHEGQALQIGVSIGLAPLDAGVARSEDALAAADAACYQAKSAGRNGVFG